MLIIDQNQVKPDTKVHNKIVNNCMEIIHTKGRMHLPVPEFELNEHMHQEELISIQLLDDQSCSKQE